MEIRHRILGTMLTMTTYGTWLRGDERGWVDDGKTFPANPLLESIDHARLKHDPYLFDLTRRQEIGEALGYALFDRLKQRLLALAVQSWHIHFVVAESAVKCEDVAKCAKEAVRYHIKPKRPIWTDKYDKRFCFNEAALQTRIAYVEQHNIENGLPARPWDFLV